MNEEHSSATAPARQAIIIIALLVPKSATVGPVEMKARMSPMNKAMLMTEQALPSTAVDLSCHSLRNSMFFSCTTEHTHTGSNGSGGIGIARWLCSIYICN